MTNIHIDNISKSFSNENGEAEQVLTDISFEAAEGSFVSLLGPSGCGKTTLLNIISGLLSPDSGVIKQDGIPMRQDELSFSYVFQEPRLLEWATVGENISFALNGQGIPKEDHPELIKTYLEMVDLAEEADSYPQNLSGGMQQRVGIARALAVESDVVLMDEPFSSLDGITAQRLRDDLLEIWKEMNKTIIFVTHNIREAIYMSDTILMMAPKQGIIHRETVQIQRPREMKDQELLKRESVLMDIMEKGVGETI